MKHPEPTSSSARRGGTGSSDIVAMFACDDGDPTPIHRQLQRCVQFAIAERRVNPGDTLPTVRSLAHHLGLSHTTVGRAYANLAREGMIVTRAGAGSAIAAYEPLAPSGLQPTSHERLQVLTRVVVAGALELGCDADQIDDALAIELALLKPGGSICSPSEAEQGKPSRRSPKSRLQATISSVRAGDRLTEVALEVPRGRVVAAISPAAVRRLGLEPGCQVSAYVNASAITLGP